MRAVTRPGDGGAPASDGTATVWRHESRVLVGRGEAARIELPDGLEGASKLVAAFLADFEVDDTVGLPGCGPVAFGALPFDRTAPCHLTVPAEIRGWDASGASWLTTVDAPTARRDRREGRQPDGFSLVSSRPQQHYVDAVAAGVGAIRAGRVRKVVLAREVVVEADRDIPVGTVLERLSALYPSCMVFSVEGFVGASPELLAARIGPLVRSHPLAGTTARSGDPETDARHEAELRASSKCREEHEYAVDDVVRGLREVGVEVDRPAGPTVLPLRNVIHLGTEISGHTVGPDPDALAIVERLHPTAAVGGTPRDAAVELIAELEQLDRGRYAGPVGWVDARGNGEWAVGIRCADIDGTRARLVAGSGIVADSDPVAELTETQLKFQVLLAAVVRP
ncbi:MAG TPA: isochorismate synthase [Acidimicrobiales bacterium]|nr:isochorismate synthase [Acidimicrobiales bacterium]